MNKSSSLKSALRALAELIKDLFAKMPVLFLVLIYLVKLVLLLYWLLTIGGVIGGVTLDGRVFTGMSYVNDGISLILWINSSNDIDALTDT